MSSQYTEQFDGSFNSYNQQIQMRKHDKIVLKSDVYKTRTPERLHNTSTKSPLSRSPISKSPYLSKKEEQKINPNQLFQKVCCPNCRFIFKIIKNSELLINTSSHKQKHTINSITQTDDSFIKDPKMIKKVSQQINKKLSQGLEKKLGQDIVKQLPSKRQSFLRKTNHMDKIPQQQSQSQHLNENSYRFENFTRRSNFRKSSPKSSIKNQSRKSDSSFTLDLNKLALPSQEKFKERESQLQAYEIKEELKDILLRYYERIRESQYIISFLKELPSTVQVPAYQKMLLYQANQIPKPIETPI